MTIAVLSFLKTSKVAAYAGLQHERRGDENFMADINQ